MTDSEWLGCDQPHLMWAHLDGVARVARRSTGRRKLRLFACACCRAMWRFLRDEEQRRAVEVAEAFADGQCDSAQLAQAKDRAWRSHCDLVGEHIAEGRPKDQEKDHVLLAAHAVGWVAHKQARAAAKVGASNLQWIQMGQEQSGLICHWLRDLFGNPFRAITIEASWLGWQEGLIPRLAQAIYEERTLPEGALNRERLSILADALEEAGCSNDEILSHCRGPGPHIRGCHVVDRLLGKD